MRFARRLIKGTMGTEGIMGLFPEIPIIPAFHEIPENSPKKAKPFNKTHLPKRETQFLVRRLQMQRSLAPLPQFLVRRLQIQRSAKIPTMGCTKAYCSLSGLFVSGSRCLPYHKKFKKLMYEVFKRFHNISRVKNNSLCLGENIEEEHICR